MIAREANVPVYVAAERYEAGLLAERDSTGQFGIHLLDDGFQHRQLARDVDILLLDGTEWSTDRLLPAGNLREPFSALRRATVVAVTAPGGLLLEKWLRSNGRWQGPIWRLMRFMQIPPLDGTVAAFCGIARPDQFFSGLERAGVKLAARINFADHHTYTVADLKLALNRWPAALELSLSSPPKKIASAWARLPQRHLRLSPLHTWVQLRVEIEDEKAAIDWLDPLVERSCVTCPSGGDPSTRRFCRHYLYCLQLRRTHYRATPPARSFPDFR